MKFEKPLSGGLLIAGSLFWDEHPTRKTLRKKFLAMHDAIDVPAPIRYGRLSEKRNTVTMVFSASCTTPDKIGQGKLVPLNKPIKSTQELDVVAKAIIKAEHKKESESQRFNWGWGCLAVLINPDASSQTKKLIKKYWPSRFGRGFTPNDYRIGKEKSLVSSSGILNIEWQGRYGDLDFIVAIATKPNIDPIPSENKLSTFFSLDGEYFHRNHHAGILTYQDSSVLNQLNNRNNSHSTTVKKRNKFSSLPEDWTLKRLGELFEFKNGINAGKESYGRGTKFINVMEVINNDYLTAELLPGSIQISKEQENLYLVSKGDVLFNRTSETSEEIGLSSVYTDEEPVVFGGFVIRGRSRNESIHTDFKRYCFRSKFVRDQIVSGGQGAIRTNIGQGDLERVLVALPPISEQKHIASILLQWDHSISILSKLLSKKEQRKKWLMQQLLTGKKRLKGFKGQWKEFHLGDFFDERNEFNHPNLPLLSIGQYGVYPQSESEKRDISNSNKSKYRRICKGDIGYNTMRMWQGRSALSHIEGIVSPAYTILKPKKNANPLFFSYLFHTPKLVHSFYRNSQGLVEDTLNCKYKDFAIVKAFLPENEEQIAIAEVISKSVREIQFLKIKLDKIREQKRGLMQILLTGKRRLKLN